MYQLYTLLLNSEAHKISLNIMKIKVKFIVQEYKTLTLYYILSYVFSYEINNISNKKQKFIS